jgi:outer membrane receptor protein involved in Fe transport
MASFTGALLVGYEFAGGFRFTLSVFVTNSFPLDYLQTVWIRAQYRLDTAVSYRWRQSRTELRLRVNNLTNQKNWAPVFDGGYFGATDVFPELPINLMLNVRKRF